MRRVFANIPDGASSPRAAGDGISQTRIVQRLVRSSGAEEGAPQPVIHDPGLVSQRAARWYAAKAAGLFRRQSRFLLASNHTNPSSP